MDFYPIYTLPSSLRAERAEHVEKCMQVCVCLEVGTVWAPRRGARRAPGPTANYFPKRKLGTAILLLWSQRHWPLNPSELGYLSGLPLPHPVQRVGRKEMGFP